MLGAHKHIGDESSPDFAVSVEAIFEVQTLLKEGWSTTPTVEDARKIEELACAILSGFSSGLRGEEIAKLDTAGFLQHFP